MNDDKKTVQTTSPNDEENTGQKYANSLYQDNKNVDYIEEEDLNSEDDDLATGLGDDAYPTYDADDDTLTGDGDEDDTETGMNEVDAEDLNPLMDKMGDVVFEDDVVE